MSRPDTRRYDGKLDSFLHKSLPWEEYERVCTSEPCVVVSPEEKRVHVHVVLCHRCIYLADFPPKNIRVAVALRDVESVRMIDDLPDFLSDKEQEESVHIQIHYRRAGGREKGLRTSLGERSPAILRKVIGKSRSDLTRRSSPLLPQPLTPQQQTRASHNSLSTVNHTTFTSLSPGTSSDGFVRSQSFSITTRPQAHVHRKAQSVSPISTKELHSQLHPPSSPSFRSRNSSSLVKLGVTLPTSQGSGLGYHADVTDSGSPASRRDEQRRKATEVRPPTRQVGRVGNLRDSQHSDSMESIESVSSSKGRRRTKDLSLAKGVVDDSWGPHHHSSSPDLYSSSLSLSTANSRGRNDLYHSTLSLSTTTTGASTLSLPTSASLSAFEGGGFLGLSGEERLLRGSERAVMDLYVLKQTTDFYHQLYRVWEDVKIRHTFEQGCLPVKKPSNTSLPHEHFSQHYCTLKQEILSAASIEASAHLVQELCTACQKYFVIKKLFWKDCDLLEHCLSQLKTYLSASSGSQRAGCSMEYKLEYSIILMDLLQQMLRETHTCPKRLVHLTRNGGQLLLALASSIISLLPATSMDHTEGLDELTEKSCGILFELIRVTQEVRWSPSKASTVSTTWLVTKIAAIPNIRGFCSRLVSYISSVLAGATPPSPQAQVTLHHAALITSTLVHSPGGLVNLFRSQFTEEFRYFISISGARKTLVEASPLSQDTIELLQSAKSIIILQG